MQGDAFNRSRIATVVCVALTSNMRWAEAPGNVLLTARATGLPKDSVANVSPLVTLDRGALTERVGALPAEKLELVLLGSRHRPSGVDAMPNKRIKLARQSVAARMEPRRSQLIRGALGEHRKARGVHWARTLVSD